MDSEDRAGPRSNAIGSGRLGAAGTSPGISLSDSLNALQATIAANRSALSSQNDAVSSRSVSPRFPGFGASPASPVGASRGDSPLTPPGSRASPFPSAGTGRSLTPILQRGGLQASSSSTALASNSAKSPDSGGSLLNIMRRELEQLEQRLTAHIKKVHDSVQASVMKSDKIREVGHSRFDQKLTTCELAQSKLDRRLSEVCGTVRGLSDEAQQHIRRADAADNRLYEFKHQMEEDFKNKMSELTLQYQEMVSKCRTTWSAGEDAQKRILQQVKRLEAHAQEHIGETNDAGLRLADLQTRVEQLEEGLNFQQEAANTRAMSEEIAVRRPSLSGERDPSAAWKYEQQLNDIEQKVERLFNDAHGEESYDAKLHEFEVRLAGVRSKMDSQEALSTTVEQKLKQDFNERLDGLRKKMEEMSGKQLDLQELVQKQMRGAKAADESLEELRSMCQVRARTPADVSLDSQVDAGGRPGAIRVEHLQQDIVAMATEVQLLNTKFAEIDSMIASKDTKEKLDVMDTQRRVLQMEHAMQSMSERLESRGFVERNAPPELAERNKAAEQKLAVVQRELMEEDRQNTATMAERMQQSEKGLSELWEKFNILQMNDGEVAQVSLQATEALNELKKEVQIIKDKEEHLMRHTATLKELAEKLSDVQRDTARHCRWALSDSKATGTSQSQIVQRSLSIEAPANVQAQGSGVALASDAVARVGSLEVRMGTAEELIKALRQDLISLSSGQAIKSSDSQDLRNELTAMINRKLDAEALSKFPQNGVFAREGMGLDGMNDYGCPLVPLLSEADGAIVAQELDGLFQRVEEGEMECVKLQDQLKGRIAHMDKLLDKVAKEVLGPEGAAVASAQSITAGEVEAMSRSLPKGMRLCVLGGKDFKNLENRQLVEAIARQVGVAFAGSMIVLTTGKQGVQENFVASLGNTLPVVNLVSAAEASGFGVGTDLVAGDTLEERMSVLGQIGDVYLTVEGGPVVAKEATVATQRQAAVIPLKSTGGASAGMFEFPQEALRKPSWATQEQWEKLESKAPPDQMAATIVAMLRAILRDRSTNSIRSTALAG